MKEFTKDDLINFFPRFRTFVGIDSDGCIFDTMEAKQKDFFHPAIIRHWKLEAIEPQVRAAAEFTYLYSCYRGLNRFLGLCKTFELLNDWSDARDKAALPICAPIATPACRSATPPSKRKPNGSEAPCWPKPTNGASNSMSPSIQKWPTRHPSKGRKRH